MTITVRFAPSPTGLLHAGNARTALLNWLFAKKLGGRFLLRIDDTDAARSTKAFEEAIYRDLAWLGLTHDGTDRQINRLAKYSAAFYRLQAAGLIERQVAILSADRLAPMLGYGLEAIVEVTLERQGAEHLTDFETRVIADDAVQQCYRVSPGPDFILHVRATDMPAYLALQQRLFTAEANVRNVKAFFSVKRAKFAPRLPLGAASNAP